MGWLDVPRVDEPEMIDAPDQPIADLASSMGDVARTNVLFGGTNAIVGGVANLLMSVPKEQPIRILDIGCGSGDIARALVHWGRRTGRVVEVVAVDNLWNMLTIAKAAPSGFTQGSGPLTPNPGGTGLGARDLDFHGSDRSKISFIQSDALALPFRPGSFDIVTCALTFHHLGFDESARVLAQMDRLSTRGFVVTDLRRDRLSHAMVSAGLMVMRSHPFTRHDGPASVLRAFTPREYAQIVALSGVQGVRISSSWYYRIVLTRSK